MEVEQFAAIFGSSPIPSQAVGSKARTTTATPKLRDCCLGCASSKVRCPREKPACSRCVKRKTTCEYLASKRAGRKHDASDCHASHGDSTGSIMNFDLEDTGIVDDIFPQRIASAAPDAVSKLFPALSSWFAPSTATTPGVIRSLDASFLLSPQDLGTDASLESMTSVNTSQPFLNLLSPDSHSSDNSWTVDADMLLGDALENDITLNDAPNFGNNKSCEDISSSLALSPGTLLEGNIPGIRNIKHTAPSSETPAKKPANFVGPGGGQDTKDSQCSCLTQALGFMKQLFPQPSTFCTTSGISGANNLLLLPTVPIVIERNRHTVEAVRAMLACSCSHDVHLLAIMAHIVFKVLGWYAVAARRTSPIPSGTPTTITSSGSNDNGSTSASSESSTSSGGQSSSTRRSSMTTSSSYTEQVCWQAENVGYYHLDGGRSDRMAAQLVLSEMHRVQGLVRELGAKLKAESTEEPTSEQAGTGVEQSLLPFSGVILNLLGADLRKRLKELSVEIVGSLRAD